MNLEQLEINLTNYGFKVSKYLTPEEGFALSHPALSSDLSDKAEIIVMREGDKYKIFFSTAVIQHSLLSPIREIDGHEVIEQVIHRLKIHVYAVFIKELWAAIVERLTLAQYEKIMGGDRSYKASALRVMKVSKSKKIHSLCTDLIQAYDRYFEFSLHNK
jgi:hypothetical protein